MFPLMFSPMVPNLRKLWNDYNIPPTVYALLNSYVNFSKEEPEKIKDLAKLGRSMFFDFEYPLTNKITKEQFETMILNHFLMRRIGYETVTAFNIALSVKINEIMPKYNILFNALDGWEIFNSGETTTRTMTDNTISESESTVSTTDSNSNTTTSNSNSSNTTDNRFSNTPQNAIQDVQAGKYVSEYRYINENTNVSTNTNTQDSGTSSSIAGNSGEDNKTVNETITKTPADKIKVYTEFVKNYNNIFSMIFEDLEPLFYQIAL